MSGIANFISSRKFIITYFLLLPVVIYIACWGNTRAAHEMFAFSFSDSSPEIYVGSFYTKSESNLLDFKGYRRETIQQKNTQGALSITRDGQALTPTFDKQINPTSNFHIYDVKVGDQLCWDKNCTPINDELKIGVLAEGNETYLTNVSAKIPTTDLPVSKSIFIHSEKSIDIFVADLTTHQIKKISLSDNIAKPINFYKSSSSPHRLSNIIMLAFSALFWSGFFYILLFVISRHYKKIDIYGIIIILIVAFQYFVLFPGVFTGDMIVNEVGGGKYMLSYSSLFMLLNILIGLFNFKVIQLPVIVLFLMALFAIINSIKNEKVKRIFYIILIVLIVLCPDIYAILYVSQRYFYPPLLLILSIYFFMKSISVEKYKYYNITYAMLFAGMAFMLREEYAIFILAYFAIFYIYRGSINLKKVRVCLITVISLGVSYYFIGEVIPKLYKADTKYAKVRLLNVSMLDVVQPYVPCPGSEAERNQLKSSSYIAKGIELSGGLKVYCDSPYPEYFVWNGAKGVWVPYAEQKEISDNLKKGYLISLIVLPQPALERMKVRGLATINLFVWQLADQYEKRNIDNGYHPANADRMNLVLDRPHVKPLTQFTLRVGNYFNGSVNYWNWLAVLLVVFVYPIIFYRTKAAFTINIAVIIYALASIEMSPTANWAYIVMAIIWAIFAIPLALMERDWLQQNKSKKSDAST